MIASKEEKLTPQKNFCARDRSLTTAPPRTLRPLQQHTKHSQAAILSLTALHALQLLRYFALCLHTSLQPPSLRSCRSSTLSKSLSGERAQRSEKCSKAAGSLSVPSIATFKFFQYILAVPLPPTHFNQHSYLSSRTKPLNTERTRD